MRTVKLLLSGLLLGSTVAFAGGGSGTASRPTIAGIVASDPNFSTLLAAVQAAGLVDTLNGAGPFTVFAPTNAAFAKIPRDQLDALLNDRAALTRVLTYHVVPGRVTSQQVVRLTSATTVEGSPVRVSVSGGAVRINDARVTAVDVGASNGVIHVIDTVLLPP
ncbi:fasciclin domain-containing protein, partial [Deinococcus pimensis]|uniref:fasciclin domain-containing protein n=1 Tax=Deinococcus pimensis TaxID=309888 RepID=UPI0009FF5936